MSDRSVGPADLPSPAVSDTRFGIALSRGEQVAAWRLMLVFCLLYIYELANFNLTIDDEFLALSPICQAADIGRWVHPLLRTVLWPQVVVPSGPLLLFGVAFAVAFVYTARLFGVVRFGLFHYAAFAAYALFPTWIAQLEFAANVLPNAVGVLGATCAALFTVEPASARRGRGWRLGMAVVACAVAIGAYQSLGLMYLALVVGSGLMAWQQGAGPAWGGFARTVARGLLVLALGLALSLVLARLVMMACDVAPSGYGSGILHFQEALRHPLRALGVAVNEVRRLYFSFWRPFGMASLTYLATVFLCCYLIVRLAARGTRWRVGGALFVLLMVPSILSLVGANTMTVRTFFAGAVVLLCLLLIAYARSRTAMQQRTVLVLAVLCAVQGLYVNSVQQARGWAVARHDLLLAGAIHAEIARLHGADDGGPIEVNFRGGHAFRSVYPAIRTTSSGASFFEWDGGDQWRIVAYMNLIGYDRLRVYAENPPGAFDREYAQMPAWPVAGSVRRVGTGYLVKLSEPSVSAK